MHIAIVGAEHTLGAHLQTELQFRGHEITALITAVDVAHLFDGKPRPDVLVVAAWPDNSTAYAQAADIRDWAQGTRVLICLGEGGYPKQLTSPPFETYEVIPGRPPRTIAGARPVHERDLDFNATPAAEFDLILERILTTPAVPLTVARLFGVYGYDWPSRVTSAIEIALNREPRALIGAEQIGDAIHLDDVVGALAALIEQGVEGPVNIGTGVALSNETIAETVYDVLDDPSYVVAFEYSAGFPACFQVCDPTTMARHYQPRITLREGIERQFAYLRDSRRS